MAAVILKKAKGVVRITLRILKNTAFIKIYHPEIIDAWSQNRLRLLRFTLCETAVVAVQRSKMGAAHARKGAALNPPKVAPLETAVFAVRRSQTIFYFYFLYPPSTAAHSA